MREIKLGCLGAIGFFVLLGGCIATMTSWDREEFTQRTNSTTNSRKQSDHSYAAWVIVKRDVENKLKAPATAVFSEGEYSSRKVGDDEYLVEGFVDSENTFSANIRTRFVYLLKNEPGTWKLIDSAFDYTDIERARVITASIRLKHAAIDKPE